MLKLGKIDTNLSRCHPTGRGPTKTPAFKYLRNDLTISVFIKECPQVSAFPIPNKSMKPSLSSPGSTSSLCINVLISYSFSNFIKPFLNKVSANPIANNPTVSSLSSSSPVNFFKFNSSAMT